LSCLQLVQNASAWLLTGTRKREHILPYLSDLLTLHTPTRSLRSADQMLLVVSSSRLNHRGDRAFAVADPRLWNNVPLHIRTSSTLGNFKTHLKTHFYSLAFRQD
ncbi:hypothetical protein LDENG_00107300, partial [Lucifuga dentata]